MMWVPPPTTGRFGCLHTKKLKEFGSKHEAEVLAVELLRRLGLKSEEGGYQVGKTKVRHIQNLCVGGPQQSSTCTFFFGRGEGGASPSQWEAQKSSGVLMSIAELCGL